MITFLKKHIWLLILVLAILLIPQSLNIQSELNMRIVITAMGIDYVDDQYEVTAQVIMPTSSSEGGGGSASLDFISAKGQSVSDAVNKVSFQIGKTLGLGHINTLIFGENVVKNEKLIPSIDYFIRVGQIPTSSMVLIVKGEVKKEMEKTKSLDLSTAAGLRKAFLYKEQSMNGMMVQLEKFANAYYQIGSCNMISGLEFEESDGGQGGGGSESGGGSSGGGSESSGGGSSGGGSSGQSSSGEQKKQNLKFDNPVYLFKSGKLTHTFESEEELAGLNYLNHSSKSGIVVVKGITDQTYDNATVSVFLRDKGVKMKYKFEDGKPVCEVNIKTNRNEVIEINNSKGERIDLLYEQEQYLTQALVKAVKEEISTKIKKVFEVSKSANSDMLHVGNGLYSYLPKQWKKLYQEYGDNYLSQVEIKVNVEIGKQL